MTIEVILNAAKEAVKDANESITILPTVYAVGAFTSNMQMIPAEEAFVKRRMTSDEYWAWVQEQNRTHSNLRNEQRNY